MRGQDGSMEWDEVRIFSRRRVGNPEAMLALPILLKIRRFCE